MTDEQFKNSGEKLAALQAQLAAQGLDGFIVPHADEFQNEYTPPSAERLAWLTGFTGSAGIAVVLRDKAVVMSDGRYTEQLKLQVDKQTFAAQDETDVAAWLGDNAKPGAKIGYDPKLHADSELRWWLKDLKSKKIEFVPLSSNPVDAIWTNRPAAPSSTVEIFPEAIAGRSAADKREEIAKDVKDAGGHAVVIAQPASIAWMLNIRGKDVPMVPVALSYAVVRDNGDTDLFIDPARITPDVRTHLGNHVTVRDPAELDQALADLAGAAAAEGKPVLTDPVRTAVYFRTALQNAGAAVEDMEDPTRKSRVIKTPQEQKSIIETHVRDGVSMVRFLKWVEEEAPKGNLTEIDIAERLRAFRDMDSGIVDDSFNTICGWAGNGAIVHYHATRETNKTITPPGILLVDSGAQYREGTTDITRTVAIGPPTAEMRENFTRVLRGHIGVATAIAPEKTLGAQFDAFARRPLWEAKRDYDHGTGHDVDCYLSVHGAGGAITKIREIPLRIGMLVSNEPGFYKAGEYGIRIENLVLIKDAGAREGTDGKKRMMEFETVTLAPIDRNLIVPEMMSGDELQWLNDYHERVYQTLAPRLDASTAAWLRNATAPVKKNDSAPDLGNRPRPPTPGPFC